MYESAINVNVNAKVLALKSKNIELLLTIYQNLWNTLRFVESKAKITAHTDKHHYWNSQQTILIKHIDLLSPFVQLKKMELELIRYKQTYDDIVNISKKTNKQSVYKSQTEEFEKKYTLAYYSWEKKYNGMSEQQLKNCENAFVKLEKILSRK